MAAPRKLSGDDLARARAWADEGVPRQEIADRLGVTRSGLWRALQREDHDTAREGAVVEGDSATVTTAHPGDVDRLVRSFGEDPAKWVVERSKLNEWSGPDGTPRRQMVVHLKRSGASLLLAPVDHVPPVERPPVVRHDGPSLGVVVADTHAPFQDEGLHACLLAFLADVRPDWAVDAGDLLDFPEPSRHRPNPKWHASPRETLEAGYRVARDRIESSPGTDWTLVLGNHDVRVRRFLLDTSPAIADLAPVGEVTPALAISRLLHAERLGLRVIEPEGDYTDGEVEILRNLSVIHGYATGPNAVTKTLDEAGRSTLFGHTHAKASTYRTVWDGREPSVRTCVNVGCMARVDGGLGYKPRPNWQQGFATVVTWPDGRFTVEHATYVGGTLLWRDRRWSA